MNISRGMQFEFCIRRLVVKFLGVGGLLRFACLFLALAMTPISALRAETLDANCTIAILNRTVNVQADGSWYLPDVPSGFGSVRARATCIKNGVTTSGQSEFFNVTASRMNSIQSFDLNNADPIPTSLSILGQATLTSIDATSQLVVTAIYPDGSTSVVTAQANGTNYTISNPAVATVSTEGLVTAVSSGTVIISASNEGAVGLIQIRVQLSGDSDNDGIPDDLEIANGLDPNNPVDALEDPDGDGLNNKQELVDYGTNPNLADTDSDGILDGEEVVAV
jgi:large repetitive protein